MKSLGSKGEEEKKKLNVFLKNVKEGNARETEKPAASRRASLSVSPREKITPPTRYGVSSTKENVPTKMSATRSRRLSTASKPLGSLSNAIKPSNNVAATKVRSPPKKAPLVKAPAISVSASNTSLTPKTSSPASARPASNRAPWNSPVTKKRTGVISSPTKTQMPMKGMPTRSRASSVSSMKPASMKTHINTKRSSIAKLANCAPSPRAPSRSKLLDVDKNFLLALERYGNFGGSSGNLDSVTEENLGNSCLDSSGSAATSTPPLIMDGWSSGDDGGVLLTIFEKDIRGIQPLVDPRMVDVRFDNLRSFSTTVYTGATLRELNAYIIGKIGGHPGLRGMVTDSDGDTTYAPMVREGDLKKWLARCVDNGYDGVLECWLVGEEAI